MEMYDVVKKLLGEIDPVGETQMDERRFENLKATTGLIDKLMTDIDNVAFENRNSHEFSVKRSAEFASRFQKQMGIEE